jgi:hypothetical protein
MPLPSGLVAYLHQPQFSFMVKFQLELLFHIIGIGSASGLIYKGDSVFVISDSSNALFEYNIKTQALEKTSLDGNPTTDNIPKKTKADYEAMANYGDDFYIFGSGSTPNRNKMVQVNTQTQTMKTVDLSYLYSLMQSFGNITPQDFNIEGVVFTGEQWYFLQRGNGQSAQNGIFTVNGKNLENDFTILYNQYKLPKIKSVRSSFTDAVLVDGQLYFLACAEDSASTYEDGQVLGSLIGSVDLETMKIGKTLQVSNQHKFEGLTLYQNSAHQLEFLLCEDNDTQVLESNIYKLSVRK